MLNLSIILENSARKHPQKVAITFMSNALTYTQLNAAANQVANGLNALGVTPGDKVALSCLNLPYFPIIYFGILKAGAVVVPLSVLLKKDEVAYHLSNSDAKAYFCFSGNAILPMAKEGYEGFLKAENCSHFIEITPKPEDKPTIEGVLTFGAFLNGLSHTWESHVSNAEDTAVIIYTSGTTGRPKGAELTHNNLLINAITCSEFMRLEASDVQLTVLPLFHIFAMTVMMNAGFYKGCSNVLQARFDAPETLQLMQTNQVSVFAGVPTMYQALVAAETKHFDLEKISKQLRICVSGGASLPVQVLQDFEKKFDVPVIEGYGMSEGSPVVTFNHLDVGRKSGSVGTPVWGVQVKLVDDKGNEVSHGERGELLYKGPNVMKGYYKNPEATTNTIKNGWLYSGDIAIKDTDGFYFIVDRLKDMIIRGGLNVYPREIEEVMITHPAIAMVAIIGVPHELHGEEIMACVVLKDGENINEEDLKQWVKNRVASYKYPRIIKFMNTLPISATGKILKKELRAQLS